MGKREENAEPSFEEALGRLEAIVQAIEQGKIGLEDSIRQYEEGMKLIQRCRSILAAAELKVRKLQLSPEGRLESEPFEPEAQADAGEGKA